MTVEIQTFGFSSREDTRRLIAALCAASLTPVRVFYVAGKRPLVVSEDKLRSRRIYIDVCDWGSRSKPVRFGWSELADAFGRYTKRRTDDAIRNLVGSPDVEVWKFGVELACNT